MRNGKRPRTRRWLICGLIPVLAPWGAGCARWIAPSQATWPIPPAIAAPALDIEVRESGLIFITTPEEEGVILPHAMFSRSAWDALLIYTEALRRGYCEGRAALQIANGQTPERLPVCTGVTRRE